MDLPHRHVTIFYLLSISVRYADFYQCANTNFQMLTLNTTLVEESPLSCAATCLGMHRQCFSYLYDVNTNLCTPGAYVHTTVPQPPVDGVMFTASAIDVNLDNFNVYFKDDIIVYLHISTETVNYRKAMESCQALGGHLYTTREASKYNLLVDLVDGVYEGMWIGLNDLAEEGVFRWVDDNSTLTTDIGSLIWGRNQPDNHNNDQHCCFWWDHYRDVADFHCDREYNYACEYPVPYRY